MRVLCLGLYSIFCCTICSFDDQFLEFFLDFEDQPSVRCGVGEDIFFRFVLLTVSFALQKLLSFRRSHLLIASYSVCATGVIFRKWSPVPMCSSILPTFSSMRFSVASFMLRFLIHLNLSFAHGNRYGSFSFFYMLISGYAKKPIFKVLVCHTNSS